MGKDPAFLFYPNDYLGGTMGFSLEQHGAYLLALLFQFNNGPFTEEQIKPIMGDKWFLISSKFKKDGNKYFNDRLQSEINRRHNYSDSRRKNIGSRWNKNDKPLSGKKIDDIHMNNICNTHVIHMETRNETRNRNVKCKINIPDHLRDIWPDFEEMRKKIKHPLTSRAVELAIKKLNDLSSDPRTQVRIIEQSIFKSWQGLFPLGDDFKEKPASVKQQKDISFIKSELVKKLGPDYDHFPPDNDTDSWLLLHYTHCGG